MSAKLESLSLLFQGPIPGLWKQHPLCHHSYFGGHRSGNPRRQGNPPALRV